MTDTAIIFNNNGVYQWALGDDESAWILFRGALEILKQQTSAFCEGTDESSFSNPFIIEANHILHCQEGVFLARRSQGRHADVGEYLEAGSAMSMVPDLHIHESAIFVPDGVETMTDFDSYEEAEEKHLAKVTIVASTVLFNLGLVQHLNNQASKHAISLYQLSLSLEIPTSMLTLKIAPLNNLAILHEENDDQTSAQNLMEQLSILIEGGECEIVENDWISQIDASAFIFNKEATEMNVRLVLCPPGAASSTA
jgi:hypothetical protein